ncbi:MAG: sigma-70 family RNA polymerase sigma factor [Alphaproteobacteria bacterium]|nr:sigma-70 family RNA polymerase sigma factor [Alphaproteobacteria bacterium]
MTGEIPRLRRFARVLARDPDRADDLVQEALTRAISRIETFQPGTSMRAWLFTIVHNTHISAARRHARSPISEVTDLDLVPAPVAPRQESGLAMRDLASAFAALPENQQQVMMLVAVEGMDYADAARVLEVPVGTVRSRLSRARDALRAALGEDPRARPAEAP